MSRNFVYTSYSHPSDLSDSYFEPTYDYYDVFALKTKLQPLSLKISPTTTVDLTPNFMKGGYWQQVVYFKDKGVVVILDDEKRKKLSQQVHKYENDPYCLIYDATIPLYGDVEWQKSILPYVAFLLKDFDIKVSKNKIFVALDRYGDYEETYASICSIIYDELSYLYSHEGKIYSSDDDVKDLQLYDTIDKELSIYCKD
jgi:hypothetical protein